MRLISGRKYYSYYLIIARIVALSRAPHFFERLAKTEPPDASWGACPSSYIMGHYSGLSIGGSGSFV